MTPAPDVGRTPQTARDNRSAQTTNPVRGSAAPTALCLLCAHPRTVVTGPWESLATFLRRVARRPRTGTDTPVCEWDDLGDVDSDFCGCTSTFHRA